jgi:hypothetical protein
MLQTYYLKQLPISHGHNVQYSRAQLASLTSPGRTLTRTWSRMPATSHSTGISFFGLLISRGLRNACLWLWSEGIELVDIGGNILLLVIWQSCVGYLDLILNSLQTSVTHDDEKWRRGLGRVDRGQGVFNAEFSCVGLLI